MTNITCYVVFVVVNKLSLACVNAVLWLSIRLTILFNDNYLRGETIIFIRIE